VAAQRKADEEKARLEDEQKRAKEDMERRKREREDNTDKRPLKAPIKKVIAPQIIYFAVTDDFTGC
jgi:hypothetical protein